MDNLDILEKLDILEILDILRYRITQTYSSGARRLRVTCVQIRELLEDYVEDEASQFRTARKEGRFADADWHAARLDILLEIILDIDMN